MTQPDFLTLREHLEGAADPPDFGVISRRRYRRTRRWTALGAAGLTLIVLAGVTWGLRGGGQRAEPIAPPPPVVSSISSAAGTLFAFEPASRVIWFSTDRGGRWQKLMSMNDLPGTARLAGANANSTWLLTDEELYYVSHNNYTGSPATPVDSHSVAKERLWLVMQGQVQIRRSNREPLPANDLPAPASRVVALSAEAALVMTTSGEWYYTYDSGTRWTPRPHPCAAITSVTAPLDRSVWTLCLDGRLFLSTNDGETWQPRGTLDALSLHPVSKTVLWCTAIGPALRRTTDGDGFETVWADAAGGFTALDAETAMRLDAGGHPHLTRDGGRTWTPVRW